MKYFGLILMLTLAAAGCTDANIHQELLDMSEISLTWKGDTQVMYSEESHQLGYNDLRNEYRVYDDKLSDWFIIRCDSKPSEVGQTLTADVYWTGDKSTRKLNDLQFTVEKTDGSGKVWIWNPQNRIGIVIKKQ